MPGSGWRGSIGWGSTAARTTAGSSPAPPQWSRVWLPRAIDAWRGTIRKPFPSTRSTRPPGGMITCLPNSMLRFFRTPGMTQTRVEAIVSIAERVVGRLPGPVGTEYCFYVEEMGGPLDAQDLTVLRYVLSETFEPERFGPDSFLDRRFPTVIEYGPRLNFETAWSSAAVEICRRSGVRSVRRLERSVRIGLPVAISDQQAEELLALPPRPHDGDAVSRASDLVRDRSRPQAGGGHPAAPGGRGGAAGVRPGVRLQLGCRRPRAHRRHLPAAGTRSHGRGALPDRAGQLGALPPLGVQGRALGGRRPRARTESHGYREAAARRRRLPTR